jgi:uncharacterized YigZ family protein
LVPAGRHRTQIEVRRSVFVTTVDAAPSVESARELVREMRAEIPGAGHHVYAFVVGHGASVTCGASDDGEPSGTAGPPSLAVVQASGIGDVCLVTSRVFGGTKLGTGGLVRAYTEAARQGIRELPTTWHRDWVPVRIEVPYAEYERVMMLLTGAGAANVERTAGRVITLEAIVDAGTLDDLRARVADASAGTLVLQQIARP